MRNKSAKYVTNIKLVNLLWMVLPAFLLPNTCITRVSHFLPKPLLFLPSTSTSFTIAASSSSVGFWPKLLMTVPSSLVVIVPSPSLSNKENASRNSIKENRSR